jgi:hypothetical protein
MPYKSELFLSTKIAINQDCKIIKNTEIDSNVLTLWQSIYWNSEWNNQSVSTFIYNLQI